MDKHRIVKFLQGLAREVLLLYGLEACPFLLSDYNSLDFVVNRFFMKLFKTNNLETLLIVGRNLILTYL